MFGKRRTGAVALALALSIGVAACGGGGDDSGVGSADPDVTLRYAHAIPINSMDPHNSGNVYDYPYVFLTYDRLTYLDPEGAPQPMLATEWEVAEDAMSLTMTLRDGVTFHDGTALDATAVKANFDRMLESSVASQLSMLDSVEVIDDLTVAINLTTPTAAAMPAILGGFPGTMMSPDAFANPDIGTIAVGAGPYQVVDNKGADGITYEKYDDYWDPDAQTASTIIFNAIPDDETRFNAVLSGAVDGTLIRGPQEERASGGGLNVVSAQAASPTFLEINMNRSEFGDPRVRQAILYAIDRDEIAAAAFGGQCTPAQQLFNDEHWAHDADLGTPYERDPDKARQLLADAGLPDGFSFQLASNPSPAYTTASEVLQAQLGEVGIDAQIEILEGTETATKVRIDRSVDSTIGVDALVLDPSVVVNTFFGPGGYLNIADYDNQALNDLAAQAASVEDQQERAQYYAEIQQIVLDEALNPLVMCFQQQIWAFGSEVNGFEIGQTGMWDFRHVVKGAS